METTNQVTTNVEQLMQTVENSFPSVWSKEDVLRLLSQVEVQAPEQTQPLTEVSVNMYERIEKCMEWLEQRIESVESALSDLEVDLSEVELSFSSYDHTISVDDAPINKGEVQDEIQGVIEAFSDLRKVLDELTPKSEGENTLIVTEE